MMPDDFDATLIALIPDLRRMARGFTRDRDGADDLVQSTLERALRKRDLYQPTGPFLGWLKMIMRNLFIDGVRRNRMLVSIQDEEFVETHGAYTPASQHDARTLTETLALIEGLPKTFRETLTTVAIHGDSYEEAATQFQVPLGTVRSRLFRARAELSRELNHGADLVSGADQVRADRHSSRP